MAPSPIPTPPAPPADLLLDLSTIAREFGVRIDRQRYRLLSADQLGLIAAHFVLSVRPRIDELWTRGVGQLTPAEATELEALIGQIVAHVLEAPAEVVAKLTPLQRFEVVLAFRELPSSSDAAGASPTPSRSTGARSSRGSSKPIRARRPGPGSTTRRSRSSGRARS